MRFRLIISCLLLLTACNSQINTAPVVEDVDDVINPQFNSFIEYFDYYLSSGDQRRDSVRVEEVLVGYQRINIDGTDVKIDFELLPHKIFVLAKEGWDRIDSQKLQNFYFQLERPSACASQALYGIVNLDECETVLAIEDFGPFEGKLGELVEFQVELDSTGL